MLVVLEEEAGKMDLKLKAGLMLVICVIVWNFVIICDNVDMS